MNKFQDNDADEEDVVVEEATWRRTLPAAII